MPERFRDYVDPVSPKAAIDRLDHDLGGPPVVPPRSGLRGKIQGIRRGQQHKEGQHRLDITVGGEDTTEIIVRVPSGAYVDWDGKKIIMYLDE